MHAHKYYGWVTLPESKCALLCDSVSEGRNLSSGPEIGEGKNENELVNSIVVPLF